jgi:hypothetical protein
MTNLDAEIEQWFADFARFREMVRAQWGIGA